VGGPDSLSTIVDERNIPQPALLWRPNLAEHKQQQQIVEAIETAAYYKRPREACAITGRCTNGSFRWAGLGSCDLAAKPLQVSKITAENVKAFLCAID
jgi:hypothetical protein